MSNQENALAKKYNVGTLIRFALPTIAMMLFNALYTGVDGIFVARYVSTDALSAINIVLPVTSALWGLGTMFATGGSAMIARKMGEGAEKEARQNFTAIVLVAIMLGIVLDLMGTLYLQEIVRVLGANTSVLPHRIDYLGILILFAPSVLIQVLFQSLFVTAGKPQLGLGVMIGAGIANLVFDYLFIVVMGQGIAGAAIATGIGYSIATVAGLLLFARNKGILYFTKPKLQAKELGLTIYNGSSEMVTQIALAITIYIINISTMRFAGADGVAAATIIRNAQYLFVTLVLGFSMGVAPIISFHYGARNKEELHRIIKLCLCYEISMSVVLFGLCLVCAPIITSLYAMEGSGAYQLAIDGFQIFAFSFLFSGIGIFTSAMFTALSNGKVSALLSFIRTFALLALFLLLLPKFLGIAGVWLATPLADFLGALLAVWLILRYRKKYFSNDAACN